MTPETRGRVLRLALLGWGLGHLALGRRALGIALLAGEATGAAVVAILSASLADTTAYLVPFLAGVAFLVCWAWQAVAAYRSAKGVDPEPLSVPSRSPAAAVAWLSLPLLAWGSGYWLFAAQAATPAGVLNRFVSDWADGRLAAAGWPPALVGAADAAVARLDELCANGALRDDCAAGEGRFRDVRVRLTEIGDRRAAGLAEAVRFVRRPSTVLGIFGGSELTPLPVESLLGFELAADPVALPGGIDLGARRWRLSSIDAAAP